MQSKLIGAVFILGGAYLVIRGFKAVK